MKLQSGWQTFLWRLGSIWRMLLHGGSLTRLVAGALSSLLCGPHQKAALCPSEHTVQVRVKRKPCCLLRHIVIFEISYIMWEITTQRHESQEVGITEANLEPDSYICSLQTVCVCVCVCVCSVASVMSNSLWPSGLWPASLLCPWDSLGENTGVDCHTLLLGIFPTQGSNWLKTTSLSYN